MKSDTKNECVLHDNVPGHGFYRKFYRECAFWNKIIKMIIERAKTFPGRQTSRAKAVWPDKFVEWWAVPCAWNTEKVQRFSSHCLK